MVEREGRSALGGVTWEALWEQLSGPIAVGDMQGRTVDVNPALCRMLGYDRETLRALPPAEVTHPDEPVLDAGAIEAMVADGTEHFSTEKRLVRSDGTTIWVLIKSSLVRSPQGTPQLVASQFHDVTARHEVEELWHRTLIHAPIGMVLFDLNGYCVEVNDRLCALVGYPREELLGRRCTDMLYTDDTAAVEALYTDLRDGRVDSGQLELCVRHRDGHPFWMFARLSAVRDPDDRPIHLVGQYDALGSNEVSEARLAELTRMALHDPLTDLANRALLFERFDQALSMLAGRAGMLAVLMVDVDGLKQINDRHGHQTGDRVLQATAGELLDSVRSGDTVARYGGDEFVVLAHVSHVAQGEAVRDRIMHRLRTEFAEQVQISASVGLVTTDDPSSSLRTLLDSADRHMYTDKPRRE